MKTNVYGVSWALGELLSLIKKGLEMEEETHLLATKGPRTVCAWLIHLSVLHRDFLRIWIQFILSIKKEQNKTCLLHCLNTY